MRREAKGRLLAFLQKAEERFICILETWSTQQGKKKGLQAAQAGQAAKHALPQVADGVLPQVQALQEAQAHEGRVLQAGQVVGGEVPGTGATTQQL